MGTPTRSDTFNYPLNYRETVSIGGRVDQDWMYQQLQEQIRFQNYDLFDAVFNEYAVLNGLTAASLNNSTGAAVINPGQLYIFGRAENVAGATLNYGSTVAINTIYAEFYSQQLTSVQDPTLVDPNTGSAVFEEVQTVVSLASSTPDVIDETFETFVSGVPKNYLLNASWVLNSGSIAQGAPAKNGRYALQMNYTNGTATTVISPSFTVVPSTTYYVYFWVKTVYGQTDLLSTDGAFFRANIGTPFTSTFPTIGGSTLLGGYTLQTASFSTGVSDTSATVTLSIPATATPSSTEILIDSLLVTTTQLTTTPAQGNRHFIPIFKWNRPTTPAVITPVISPKSVLNVTDLNGNLTATGVTFTPDGGTAPDITSGTVQTAIDQLSTQRALTGGSTGSSFLVADGTVEQDAPSIKQIQYGGPLWAGTSTGSGTPTAYAITVSPTLVAQPIGTTLRFIANVANTGAATIAIDGLTALNLLRSDGTSLQTGDIQSGQVIQITVASSTTAMIYTPSNTFLQQVWQNFYGVDTGPTNACAVTLSPIPTAVPNGFPLYFLVANTNTGNTTLNVNSIGALPIIRQHTGANILPGDLVAGQIAEVIKGASGWQLMNPRDAAISGSTLLSLAADYTLTSVNTTYLQTGNITVPNGANWRLLLSVGMQVYPFFGGNPIDTQLNTITLSVTDGVFNQPLVNFIAEAVAFTKLLGAGPFATAPLNAFWVTPTYTAGSTINIQLKVVQSVAGSTGIFGKVVGGASTYLQYTWVSSY